MDRRFFVAYTYPVPPLGVREPRMLSESFVMDEMDVANHVANRIRNSERLRSVSIDIETT